MVDHRLLRVSVTLLFVVAEGSSRREDRQQIHARRNARVVES